MVQKAIILLHTASDGERVWFDKFREGDQSTAGFDEEDVGGKERVPGSS